MSDPVTDLTVLAVGQGGDGSLTVTSLLADLLGRRGMEPYQVRDVASRIKGGKAAAYLRASTPGRTNVGDAVDLVLSLGDDIPAAGPVLADDAFVVHDSSDGPARPGLFPPRATVVEVPFGRLAVRDHRRELYKNSFAFGVIARVLGLATGEARGAVQRSLQHLSTGVVQANLEALSAGLTFADENDVHDPYRNWDLPPPCPTDRMLISGNEAAAFGFLAAGGRFFAGYPITPASEILDRLQKWLPQFGGMAIQAEDELAAINMATGAALTGARAMTATSGPGIALMQEGVGHLGSAEVGVVVVDCQRAGPSTGMPTKPEQSDVSMLVFGGSGDFPRVVLAPTDAADTFGLTALATNLAERLQGPVYLAMDQHVAQNVGCVEPFDPGSVAIDRGALLTEADLAGLREYRRYAVTAEGISPWVPAGTVGGESLITGNERDQWGLVSVDPENRRRMAEKRARKIETLRPHLPRGHRRSVEGASIGLLGFGMQTGIMAEASEQLEALGVPVDVFCVRTLWPVLEDTEDFITSLSRVYVVEQNQSGQYRRVLATVGVPPQRLRSILAYDGVPLRPGDVAAHVLSEEVEEMARR